MIIAVDGPTASGKGTIAKALSAHYGLPHLDTGLLYRAVGRQVEINGGNPDNISDALAACYFDEALLNDPILRSEHIGGFASRVSVHVDVRRALDQRQRDFAHQIGGALLDGRDIGTVIAPDADAKLFITASPETRAKRRFDEMMRHGADVVYDDILADIIKRDERDIGRAAAPLIMADDAHLLDTSNLAIDAAVQRAIAMVDDILNGAV
ncbi:cytidylate kinase [Sphingorhabdus lutea]|uniref:Cytidylate kinase n=1 Tax=Sphingorhabdus lutea TaxID=1913578 RepID=A0A1L3J9X5_9SPHN|nr:d(CMP) kinase [Sphingorhabdus lutea]APG61925.1 cytidylate kinase [Sphingorhabdus lutea]